MALYFVWSALLPELQDLHKWKELGFGGIAKHSQANQPPFMYMVHHTNFGKKNNGHVSMCGYHYNMYKHNEKLKIDMVTVWFDCDSIDKCPCEARRLSWESSVQSEHLLLDLQEREREREIIALHMHNNHEQNRFCRNQQSQTISQTRSQCTSVTFHIRSDQRHAIHSRMHVSVADSLIKWTIFPSAFGDVTDFSTAALLIRSNTTGLQGTFRYKFIYYTNIKGYFSWDTSAPVSYNRPFKVSEIWKRWEMHSFLDLRRKAAPQLSQQWRSPKYQRS